MNKKVNTIIFILCATLFNILVALISFMVLTLVYVRFFMMIIPEANRSWGFTFIFLSAIAISFLAYRALLKFLLNKVDVEKYFDPLFVRKNIKKE
jgi:hypothetical protein